MADWLAKGEKHKLIVKVFVNKISEINRCDDCVLFARYCLTNERGHQCRLEPVF